MTHLINKIKTPIHKTNFEEKCYCDEYSQNTITTILYLFGIPIYKYDAENKDRAEGIKHITNQLEQLLVEKQL